MVSITSSSSSATTMIPLDGLYRKTRSHTLRSTYPKNPNHNHTTTIKEINIPIPLVSKESKQSTPTFHTPLTKKRKYKTTKITNSQNKKTPSTNNTNNKNITIGTQTPTSIRGYAHPTPIKTVVHNEQEFRNHQVSLIYKLIRQSTGTLGGNGAGGAIYGEITQNSFQKIINYLKENCNLNQHSLFLDIGPGLGKPNFHAAIDPSVAISYGIELETLRWQLSLHNLRSALVNNKEIRNYSRLMFIEGDITNCQTLDPFTHVYSFDVGFPPKVMKEIAKRFNQSHVQYFTNFHPPKKMQGVYGFLVEEIGRVSTQMHGSSEGHTCYFYEKIGNQKEKNNQSRREDNEQKDITLFGYKLNGFSSSTVNPKETRIMTTTLTPIDPLFVDGFNRLKKGHDEILKWIDHYFYTEKRNGRTRRQKTLSSEIVKKEKPLSVYYLPVKKEYYRPEEYLQTSKSLRTAFQDY